jgi:phosphatidylserine/phosphatidylglycerophosphate/cardiolipin synthase-like enzyme
MVTSAPASERTPARRAEPDAAHRIAEEGRNCWRVARANRVAFLIDGANYFRALARAFMEAERTIFILGWDVHAGVRLLPDEPIGEWPTELGRLLNALARKRRRLHVYVLDWDFAVIYALQRQMFRC